MNSKLGGSPSLVRSKNPSQHLSACLKPWARINGSKHGHMRELRTQHEGRPYRTLYAFDPRRAAILLIGGDKTGNDRWYETQVPLADELYDEHLEELKKEGN